LLGLLIWLMVLLSWILLSVLIFGHTDFTFSLRSKARLTNVHSSGKDPSTLGLTLLELLDGLALLLVFFGPFGGLHTGGGIALLVSGELVASLGVGLISLTLLKVAPAIYAHAFSYISIGQTNENVAT
jgi:hypothetical protein